MVQIKLKENLKKGTFSGVLPMMGMFIMAALMAFQSIPISDALGQQLSESFTDLGRVAETKSYGDLYFFNFVPNGAEHSVNNISYSLAKDGGNVSWSYNEFNADNDVRTDVESKLSTIISDKLKPKTKNYFDEKYGGISQGSNCQIPEINYTTIPLPDYTTDYIQGVEDNPEDIPMVVRSQVETDSSSPFYTGGEAAPMEVACMDAQGDTKYIGDTQSDSSSSSSSSTSSTSSILGTGGGLGTGGALGFLNGLNSEGLFGNWVSIGYTNSVEATANRFHVLAYETTDIYKRIHDNWVSDVEKISNTNENVCDPSNSDWRSVESRTVNDVQSDVTSGFSNVVNSEVDVDGMSGDFGLESYTLDFTYDEYNKNYDGRASYSSTDVGDCDCHSDHGEDDSGSHCHSDIYDLTVTVTPEKSVANSNIRDNDFSVNTAGGWKNLEFLVDSYNHDFESDE